MKKILLIILFSLGAYYIGLSQSFTIDSNSAIQFLYKYPHKIGLISRTYGVTSPIKIRKGYSSIKLIKNEMGLFILINGTGRVYKAVSLNNNSVTFDRIDSTEFYGNTFYSIDFSFNNNLYSYGGYGNFHNNGQLRYYNQENEWSIMGLNQELKVIDHLTNYLEEKSKLFFIEQPRLIESTGSKTTKYNAIALSIDRGENIILGEVNERIKISNAKLICDFKHMNGSLIMIDNQTYLIDYENNKIYKLINKKIEELLFTTLKNEYNTFFSINSNVFFYNKNKNVLSSIIISKSDFKLEPYPLYGKVANYAIIYTSFITILVLVILFYVYKKFNTKKKEHKQVIETDISSNEFNNIETALISALIKSAENNSFLNVNDINEILGIKKKSLEIQKRVRSETINNINHKFNIKFYQKATFIEREKSKDDKRFYNYIINLNNIKIYKS
jgi:hypothetical protein